MWLSRFVFPLSLLGAGIICFHYLSGLDREGETIFASDPRLLTALSCTADDMWIHEQVGDALFDKVELNDRDGSPSEELIIFANQGIPRSMFELAYFYISFSDDDDSEEQAYNWMVRAAEAGDILAQNELGNAYIHGELGLEQDYELAQIWLERAMSAGEQLSAGSLGELYRNGSIQPPESQSANYTATDHNLTSAETCYGPALQDLTYYKNSARYLSVHWRANALLRHELLQFSEQGGFLN